ncbi:MAG: hypothetical protein ICV59_00385 [Thermoleophilia bacterium]|nr:hypothetical protein [Thermoleophilia bacterium]
MSRASRAAMLAGAVAALAGAAVLALVELDARAWSRAMRHDDVRFQVAPRAATWQARERVPLGLARKALAIEDDVAIRRALRLFQLARTRVTGFQRTQEQGATRIRAHITLSQLVREERDPARRGMAANLLALLTFDEAVDDQRSATSLLRRSVGELRRAIALDPGNEEAKFNLELMLRLSQRGARRERERLGVFGGGEGAGAGVSAPGRGY